MQARLPAVWAACYREAEKAAPAAEGAAPKRQRTAGPLEAPAAPGAALAWEDMDIALQVGAHAALRQ